MTGVHSDSRPRYPDGMASDELRIGDCGMPDRWVVDPHFPVEFDEEMNEYHVVHKGARAQMRYCFWCGGRLPESKRGTFFTTPDMAEMAEVEALLKGAKSHEDVVRILGPPDEVHDLGGFTKDKATGGVVARWDQHYRYSTRWKTVVLHVPVLLEGRFYYSIHGHYLGGRQGGTTG
jgi:hypothetical protein